jgi:hypothetical protein
LSEPEETTASVPTAELLETFLLDLWRRTLGVSIVARDDDFFGLGGSSMQAVEMLVTVLEKLKTDLEFEKFFAKPSIATLLQAIGKTP